MDLYNLTAYDRFKERKFDLGVFQDLRSAIDTIKGFDANVWKIVLDEEALENTKSFEELERNARVKVDYPVLDIVLH